MSALLDQLLDRQRAAECAADDAEQAAMDTARYHRTTSEAWPREVPVIDGPHRRTKPLAEQVAGVMLAVFLGIAGAMALAHWWLS
jgi:hypothetical protein